MNKATEREKQGMHRRQHMLIHWEVVAFIKQKKPDMKEKGWGRGYDKQRVKKFLERKIQ